MDTELIPSLDRPLRLHPLSYLPDGDEVTVGRHDIDRYVVLDADGAALVRRIGDGATPRAAARWYEDTYGEAVDIDELLASLTELGFVAADDTPAGPTTVRFQRLGRLVCCPPALACYLAVVVTAVVVVARDPALAPGYRQLFFSPSFTLVEVVLYVGQFPLMLLHEAAHALAGRRLGLRSGLSVNHRLHFLVLETSLDGLVSVPRRRRYLPMLAGIGADLVVASVLTLLAAGLPPAAAGVCLAFAFTTLLRVLWQFMFYLQTDIYHLVCVVLGCHDLQAAARHLIGCRLRRRRPDTERWHPRDLHIARWYSLLMVAGYALTIGTALLVGLPTAYHFLTGVAGHLLGDAGASGTADSILFAALNIGQFVPVLVVLVRARSARH